MAMWPGWLKVLKPSNVMEKSWGIRPTVTTAGCQVSLWLPDCHHSVIAWVPSITTTFSLASSVRKWPNFNRESMFVGNSMFAALATWQKYLVHRCCSRNAECSWCWLVSLWGSAELRGLFLLLYLVLVPCTNLKRIKDSQHCESLEDTECWKQPSIILILYSVCTQ